MISRFAKTSGYRSDFCSSCGSPVPNKVNEGKHYWVPVGLVDDAEGMEVVAHLFVGSKAHWQLNETKAIQYEEIPPFNDIVVLLKR